MRTGRAGRGPTFVVAGAGRAGTTGLVAGLRGHPGVFVTDPKEPHYFALHGTDPAFRGPGDEEINGKAITDLADYLSLYPDHSEHLALGEGSTSTLYYHERALPELVRMNPAMKVVILLRDPVERAYSSFQYLRGQGREPEADFLRALQDGARRQADNWHHLWHYDAMSRYADPVAAFCDQMLPGHVGIWFHDDLESDYSGTLCQVATFLGLPIESGFGGDVPRVNISGTPRFQHLQQALVWASRHPLPRTTARLVTTWRFRESLRSRLIRRQGAPDDLRRAVAPAFDDDLERLRPLLAGRDRLPAWLAGSGARAG